MADRGRNLDQWLAHIEGLHPLGIDLGLTRIAEVARRLGLQPPEHRPAPRSVIVAGTNGKGSTCVALEALLRAAGLRVGTTLSPHLHVFNERVRLDGRMAADATLCEAFARVDAAREQVPLTYFEFSALVALDCFRAHGVDVAVLEVGLGGRLDAFNLVAADVAVITSIGLDHQDYLGSDLEQIGREKAGVMRPGQRVVLGAAVTRSVVDTARRLGCRSSRLGRDFDVRVHRATWDFEHPHRPAAGLPLGGFAPANCALALEAASHLVAVSGPQIAQALAALSLPGRMESWRVADRHGTRLMLLDVAHNPAGAGFLTAQLQQRYPDRRFVALVGMLADKDAEGVATALAGSVCHWICLSTRGPRGQGGAALAARLQRALPAAPVDTAADVPAALARAFAVSRPGDAILTMGSFDIVDQVRAALCAAPPDAAGAWSAVATADSAMDQQR